MFAIDGYLAVDITVNGQPAPIDMGNLMYLYMAENYLQTAATVDMAVKDVTGNFNNVFFDGAPITIAMGKLEVGPPLAKMPYRVVKKPNQPPVASGSGIRILAGYDAFKYLRDVPRKGYRGTVYEVLQQLSSELGLNGVSGEQTNDSQVWLPGMKSYALFMRDLVSHSRVDDTSLMLHCLSGAGVIMFANITKKLKDEAPVAIFSNHGKEGSIAIRDFTRIEDSGVYNLYKNYGAMEWSESLSGTPSDLLEVSVPKTAASLPVNSELYDGIQRVWTQFSALDCGNVNDTYYKAAYQNARMAGLLSVGVDVLIDRYTSLDIFDVVEIS